MITRSVERDQVGDSREGRNLKGVKGKGICAYRQIGGRKIFSVAGKSKPLLPSEDWNGPMY